MRTWELKRPFRLFNPAPWVKPEEMQPKLFSLELGLNLRLRSQAMLLFGINLVMDTLGKLKKLWRKQETADQSETVEEFSGRCPETYKSAYPGGDGRQSFEL